MTEKHGVRLSVDEDDVYLGLFTSWLLERMSLRVPLLTTDELAIDCVKDGAALGCDARELLAIYELTGHKADRRKGHDRRAAKGRSPSGLAGEFYKKKEHKG